MTPADEHDPAPEPGSGYHDDHTDSYVIDTRRKRGRVNAPRNPLGGARRMTGSRRPEEEDDTAPVADHHAAPRPEERERTPYGQDHVPYGQDRASYAQGQDDWRYAPGSTRAMPVQPPVDPHAGQARGGANPPPRRPAPRHVGASPFRPSRPPRRVHRVRRAMAMLVLLLVAWLAFLVITPLHAWSSVSKVDASPDGDRPARVSGRNYLLVGSDSRAGMSKEEQDKLATGADEGQRTDSILMVHLSDSGQKSALISLPRDSYVPIPGHGKNKINAAYSIGGPELLVDTVEQATGVHVDGYVEIGFGGFAHVVDSLGGVTIDVPFDMDDYRAGINLKKGVQTLDGPQALGFVRARYSDPEGDLGRAKRQRQFLGAIMKKAVSPATVLNPFRYWGFTHAAAEGVKIGDGTSINDLTKVMQALRASSGGDGLSLVVPISDPAYHTHVGEAVKWDTAKASAFFEAVKNDQPLQ